MKTYRLRFVTRKCLPNHNARVNHYRRTVLLRGDLDPQLRRRVLDDVHRVILLELLAGVMQKDAPMAAGSC